MFSSVVRRLTTMRQVAPLRTMSRVAAVAAHQFGQCVVSAAPACSRNVSTVVNAARAVPQVAMNSSSVYSSTSSWYVGCDPQARSCRFSCLRCRELQTWLTTTIIFVCFVVYACMCGYGMVLFTPFILTNANFVLMFICNSFLGLGLGLGLGLALFPSPPPQCIDSACFPSKHCCTTYCVND
jgi:hypothetical protein